MLLRLVYTTLHGYMYFWFVFAQKKSGSKSSTVTPDRGTQDGVAFTVGAKLCGYGTCNYN